MLARSRFALPLRPLHRPAAPPLGLVGAVCLTAAACAGRTSAPDAAPTPADAPVAANSATPAAVGATRFTWGTGQRTVEVRTDALITRDGPAPAGTAATAPGGERVVSTAYLTAQLAPADAPGATAVSGTVDSLVVDASGRVRGDTATALGGPPPATTLLTALRYRAASDARGVRVEAADPGTDLRCTATNGAAALSALSAVREALPRIPADLAAGSRWRDTTVTASCAGPVLLVAQTVARYESAADPATPGRLRVTRQTTTTARGTGSAGVRPMSVVATGNASATYALDLARGQLVNGAGEGRTSVTVTVSGVAQRFTQQTHTQLTAR